MPKAFRLSRRLPRAPVHQCPHCGHPVLRPSSLSSSWPQLSCLASPPCSPLDGTLCRPGQDSLVKCSRPPDLVFRSQTLLRRTGPTSVLAARDTGFLKSILSLRPSEQARSAPCGSPCCGPGGSQVMLGRAASGGSSEPFSNRASCALCPPPGPLASTCCCPHPSASGRQGQRSAQFTRSPAGPAQGRCPVQWPLDLFPHR